MRVPELPRVKVAVMVHGQALEEHENGDEPAPDVRYIEADSGSNFSVSVTLDKSLLQDRKQDDILDCALYIDGRHTLARAVRLSNFVTESISVHFEGTYDYNASTLSRFQFADLATSDESTAGITDGAYKELGEIQLALRWAAASKLPPQLIAAQQTPPMAGTVPEKCLKGRAISHVTGRSEPERAVPPNRVVVDWVYGKASFATYIFKYRSRLDLQIEGIIPRDPSPEPLRARNHNRQDSNVQVKEPIDLTKPVSIKAEKRNLAVVIDDEEDEDVATTHAGTGRPSSYKRQRRSPKSKQNLTDR